MGKKRNKRLYYCRAKWDNQGQVSLEELLREAHVNLRTTGDRTFKSSSGGEIKGAKVKDADDRLFFHIASYVPGEPTSTIGKDKSVASADITIEQAPEGK